MIRNGLIPLLVVVIFALAMRGVYREGLEAGERARELRYEFVQNQMSKIGICDWARVIADQVSCPQETRHP